MNPREVARAARLSIDIAHERLALGEAVLVFAEGTRSRSRGMQQLLAGASRYLDGPGAWILPVAITGTEALFPVDGDALHPVRIETRVGRPVQASALQTHAGADRRLMMDVIGLAIARLLPTEYQGAYGDDAADLEDARRVLGRLFEQT
jgi:1-acyl-sn-glycerol-3-phosphate acyltransferase